VKKFKHKLFKIGLLKFPRMPLVFKKIGSKKERIALWEITESEAFFLKKLQLNNAENAEFSAIHAPSRRVEWLAGRWILHQVSGKKTRLFVEKTAAGKPFWPTENQTSFSLSHSAGKFAAAIVSEKPCGIDFQFFTEKLHRIAPKFLNEKEIPFAADLDFLHVVWGAKEAIFKAFGRGEVDFKRHLFVEKVDTAETPTTATGSFQRAEIRLDYDLFFEKIKIAQTDWMLVWAIEK
jgi:4'-phosphopantetheinyl transferase